jgi:hypothetical protein
MTSLALNSKNDIYLGPDNNLALVTGVAATEQDCATAVKAQLGEMPLALQRGNPYLTCVFLNWKPLQFQASARALWLNLWLGNVVSIQSFTMTRVNGVGSYQAQIKTTFSDIPLDLSGNLVQ